MSVFSFGDSPPHTPNDFYDYDFGWDNDDGSNDNCDDNADRDDDPSEEDSDNCDEDEVDDSSEEFDHFDEECDDDSVGKCRICNKSVPLSFLNEHLDNQHKCSYCNDCDYMNAESLEAHIQEMHMVACKHCDAKKLTNEIAEHELSHRTVGMIQLNQLTDERFNQLVAENRIYAIEGNLYVKEPQRLTLSEQLLQVAID